MLAALRNTKLTGPRVEDYRGDLQMHSTWSDGSQTLEDIVEAGIGLRLRVLRRHRSFVRVEDRRRRLDGGARASSTRRSIA